MHILSKLFLLAGLPRAGQTVTRTDYSMSQWLGWVPAETKQGCFLGSTLKSATYINQSECTLLCYCLEFLELIDVACSIQKKTTLLLMSLLQNICMVACPKPIVGKCLLKTLPTVTLGQAICLGTVQVALHYFWFFLLFIQLLISPSWDFYNIGSNLRRFWYAIKFTNTK